MKRRRWMLIGGLVVLLGVAALALGPGVFKWARWEQAWSNELKIFKLVEPVLVLEQRSRFESDPLFPRRLHAWSTETGFKVVEFDVRLGRATFWDKTGRIQSQIGKAGEDRSTPPWRWGETDQTTPNAPWILEGITAEEFWERVKSE